MATDRCPVSVLLVEDDARIRGSIGSFLERRGYPTVLADDGPHAFELLETIERPCLVLVDFLTLRIDTGKLVAALQASDRVATLPMALVPHRAPELLSRPAMVKKPVDLEIVFRMVRDHCCGEERAGGRPTGTRDSLPDPG
jgi:CheY-like chemotaxis protein